MVAAAAATGIVSLCGNPVYADSSADGATSESPGLLSGNTLQVPVNIPITVCGNSVDVVGVLNPAFGNSCAGRSDTPDSPTIPHTPIDSPHHCGYGTPVHHGEYGSPAHHCGYSTPAHHGGHRIPVHHGGHSTPVHHGGHSTSPHVPIGWHPGHHAGNGHVTPHGTANRPPYTPAPSHLGSPSVPSSPRAATLAHTGSEDMLVASTISVAMLTGGLVLYRRTRVASRW